MFSQSFPTIFTNYRLIEKTHDGQTDTDGQIDSDRDVWSHLKRNGGKRRKNKWEKEKRKEKDGKRNEKKERIKWEKKKEM